MTDDLTQEKINLLKDVKTKLKERDDAINKSLDELTEESEDRMTKQEEHGTVEYLAGKTVGHLHAAVEINHKIDELESE